MAAAKEARSVSSSCSASVCLSSREALVRVGFAPRGSDGDGAAAKSAEARGVRSGYLRRSMRIRSAREIRAGGATRGEAVVARNGMSWFANRSCRKRKKRFSRSAPRPRRRRETVMPARERRTQKRGALRAREAFEAKKRARVRLRASRVCRRRQRKHRVLLRNLSRKRTSIADGVESKKRSTIRRLFHRKRPTNQTREASQSPFVVWGGFAVHDSTVSKPDPVECSFRDAL